MAVAATARVSPPVWPSSAAPKRPPGEFELPSLLTILGRKALEANAV
jgi:hypothetical protein